MPMSPRLLRPRATGGFDPRRIAGLVAWYDMADMSTLFQNSNGTTAAVAENDPVGYVQDKGPGGFHMAQTTNNSRPLLQLTAQNGRAAILFDGTDDFMINTTRFLNGSPASGAFVAMRQSDNPLSRANQVHAAFSSGRGGAAGETPFTGSVRSTFSSPNNQATIGGGNTRRNGAASLETGSSPTSFMVVTGGTTSNVNVQNSGDGVLLGASRDSSGVIGSAGVNAFLLSGRVGEVILYNRFLSLEERQTLERYLSAKWGIALT